MSHGVLWVLALGALAVVVVRRRSIAIALVALQSLVLGIQAITQASGTSTALLVAGIVLLAKAIALPALLALIVLRTREPGRMASERHPLARLTVALAIALAVVTLMPRFGLAHADVEDTAVGLVALGLAIAVVRRPAVFQACEFLVAENGLYLAALSVPRGFPVFIELGLVFDLVVVISVAGAFSARIHGEFGTGDTSLLGGLRD